MERVPTETQRSGWKELLQYAKQKMFYMKPGYPHLRKKGSKTQQDTARIAIFIRAIEFLDQLQIDLRRIETTAYYLKPPWKKNRYKQIDRSLCAIPKGLSNIRFHAETAKIVVEK
jgi:hypothetical protein